MKVKIGNFPAHRFYHNWLFKMFGYSPKQRISVRIDPQDTWSMDMTLAPIILPMLIQLKDTQHGYPPECTEQEWDDILDEMIWAFSQKVLASDGYGSRHWKWNWGWGSDFDASIDPGHWEDVVAQGKRITQGFKLFGKYYENLWD